MHERESPHTDRDELDHWEMYADAMDLTIEGHRLIAQEIVFEAGLLWRGMVSRLRGITGMVPRRRSIPPV
jgi:hypothetical protein